MNSELCDLQLMELDVLKEFIRVCDKYEFAYYLGWCSCSGAIHHKGFIPCDDDIDILMPYPDYEKLKKVCKNELKEDYFYQDCFAKIKKNNTTFMLEPFSKIKINWGLNIDIFPLYEMNQDNLNETLKEETVLYRKLYYKYAYTKRKFYQTGNLRNFIKVLCRCIRYQQNPEKRRRKLIEKTEEKLIQNKGDYHFDVEAVELSQPIKKDYFEKGALVAFEDIQVRVPKKYDQYLRYVFRDDDMKIPEKGSNKIYYHENVILDLHKSYLEYQK